MPFKFRLFPTFGQLPRTWRSIAIIVVVGLVEGLGISLFIPLLDILQNGGIKTNNAILNLIQSVYAALGLELTLYSSLIGIVIIVSASLTLNFIQRLVISDALFRFTQQLRANLARSTFMSNWQHLSDINQGSTINLMVQETHRGGMALLSEVMCVASIIQIFILLGFAAAISWELVLLCFMFVLISLLIIRPLLISAKRIGELKTQINKKLSFTFLDYLRGGKFIKLTATEQAVQNHLDNILEVSYQNLFASEVNKSAIYFFSQLLPLILLAAAIVTAHDLLSISASMILVFLLLLVRITPRMVQFQQQYQTYMAAASALEAVNLEIGRNTNFLESPSDHAKTHTELKNQITLDNVHFNYEGSTSAAVQGVSLKLLRNSFNALVGTSGSGKSTLVDLISGIQTPTAGHIIIDNDNLRDLQPSSWRQKIGYVGQETTIFNDTIRNNMSFAHPDATDDEIIERLKIANFIPVLDSLPNGLDTELGENGTKLSGGERQRLAIARALMGDPALLILDEATSALDNESERLIQKAVETIAGEITIIVIAHRLSTIRMADIIHVMEDGRLIESGNFDQLLKEGQRFAELYKIQYSS
ncbi:ABC transporter ATP-binding protein/permease [Rhodospirillales bacterium]|nr:ABC transporter ATP-binding protein/permease [Rhodospirillales bacterium]